MFQYDYEAWYDTDGDGLTDYIDPNSTITAYSTDQKCTGSTWYSTSYTTYPDQPVGGYIAVQSTDTDSDGDGEEDTECSFTLTAGDTFVVTLNTGSYGNEAIVNIVDPSGTSTVYSSFSTGTTNTVATLTTAGAYTVYYGDSWGDGCNPSSFYGVCWVQVSHTYVSGTTVPTVTTYGTQVDDDDDGDGFLDLDETTNCDDSSSYGSTSDPLDASSTPADIDGDLICDALDSDRDGDSYANSADAFPDDVNEWTDTDSDGTGDNSDTDDDADGTLDVDDAFPLDVCADTDTDGDGKPDTMTASCTSTLVLDGDDDDDGSWDVSDDFPLDATEDTDTDGDGIGDNTDDDDDGDGVNDANDPFPLNECGNADFDSDGMPDSLTSVGCGSVVAHVSFEEASAGNQYVDTGNSSTNHTLSNNAGESDVNYDSTSTPCMTTNSAGNFAYAGAYNCTTTLVEGQTLTFQVLSYYSMAYHSLSMTGPSGHLLAAAEYGDTYTLFHGSYGPYDEPGDYVWTQSNYLTYSMIAFQSVVTGSDLGYTASYVSTGGVGLTDGDYFGVTDYASTVGAFTDGSQGYQMSDTDGIAQLVFDVVSDADTVSMDIFVASTGWETTDYITVSYETATGSTYLLDTNGYDIDTDFSAMEGVWTTISADVSGAGSIAVQFASNSGSEAIYIDNVVVISDSLDEDMDDDNDGYDDLVDDCPYDANEHVDSDGDGFCDVQDTDDDNDGTYDLNDEFPLNPDEQTDNDQDGIGDNEDTDDDNDGITDSQDAFPNDPTESSDLDGDGVGDNADTDDDGDNVPDDEDPFPNDGSAWIDTDGDGIADYTGPPPFSGDFESGSLGGGWATSGDEPWSIVSSTTNLGGMYSAQAGPITHNQQSKLEIVVNAVNGTGSFDYDVSSETNWDFLVFCIDNSAGCLRTSGYTARWSGVTTGTYTFNVVSGYHTYTWVYWKDSSVSSNSDTAWIDDVDIPVPSGITNLDPDDDNDGTLDADDLDPLDPCVGLDTDGDGMSDNLGTSMLNGSACDPSAYTIDDDDDGDTWSDSDEATCGTDGLDSSSTPDDFDGDHVCDVMDADDDNDGFDDDVDAFPYDPSEVNDNDNDGVGDNEDGDDDNDGVNDGLDAFPNDATETEDFDGDGIGDNADTDDDADGVDDADDAFPYNPSEWDDTDGDGIGNNVDPDDDGDGVADVADPFPLDSAESADDDNDGIGNNADTDDDNDGYDDADDAFPEDSTEWNDMDGDGQGDNSDADDDGDGVNDGIDVFPEDSSEWIDTDGDGIGDNSDTDDDGDGTADADDAFPLNPSEDNDLDGDGLGDNADSDDDNDGTSDADDAFPEDSSEWIDTDGDGTGDNSDTNDDGDDYSDEVEANCGSNSLDINSVPADYDGDGICDPLDSDNTDGPDYTPEEDTSLGWSNVVPGFPALFAAIALVGAALLGRRKDD